MNGISGYLELLKSPEDNNDSLALVNSLEHCSADMLRLIDRILDFTQLLAGNLSINTELLDFSLLLAELETVYRQRCNAKALTFKVTKDDSVPKKIWGDRKKLFVIINDLLDNAVKYTRSGGIELVIKTLPTRSELGNPYDVIYSMLVSVRDTGIGIAITDRPKIFKAFSQLDGAFNRKQGGLGLGLAMCHEYIKLMNGTLTLLSDLGKGSQFDFIVDLKVIPNLAEPVTAAENGPTPRVTSANILIVEDNPTNQLVLNSILKKLGHQTTIAENGVKALEILANAEFDLILMDCQMPEMDGFEATRAIRSGNRQKNIPIIAVTANVMEGDEQRCLDAGMNDYMKKPIKKELLMEKISQWYKI
jgi:CheY-like chemotaxis protein